MSIHLVFLVITVYNYICEVNAVLLGRPIRAAGWCDEGSGAGAGG